MLGTATSASSSSASSSPEPSAVASSLDHSQSTTITTDKDTTTSVHPCRWAGCETEAKSLDHLIEHIREIHVGSGKVSLCL